MVKKSHLNIFISSTSKDLEEYRIAVRDIVLGLGYYPIMMEYFPAMDANAVKLCMDKVDEADLYIGIFAYRYGFCPEGHNVSITEMEFNRATENGIPRLCFLVDERMDWPTQYIDEEPGKSKLKAFKARLDATMVRAVFTTPENLALQVSKSLHTFQQATEFFPDQVVQKDISPVATAKLDWQNLFAVANRYSTLVLSSRYRETYRMPFYAPRKQVEAHIATFLVSSKRIAIMTGKGGMGKSSVICHVADQIQQDKKVVFVQNCAEESIIDLPMANDNTPGQTSSIWELWENNFYLQNTEPTDETKIVLIFDAINENPNPKEILEKISENLIFHSEYGVKVIIICRDPAWHFLKHSLKITNDYIYQSVSLKNEIELGVFDAAEAKFAYESYDQVFKLSQSYRDLSFQVSEFIKTPLFLGLLMKVYGSKNSPIPNMISLRQIFNQYVEDTVGSDGLNDPRSLIIDRMLSYLYELKQRALDVKVLQQDTVVGQYVKPYEWQTPFSDILESGFITQETKLIGARQKHDQVYVTYERVFEYLLADLVIDPNLPVSQTDIDLIIQLAIQKVFSPLLGALELALSFRVLDHPEQQSLLHQLADSDNPYSRQLLMDILSTIAGENLNLAQQIVQDLSAKDDLKHRAAACLFAYNLRFTDQLINLAKSKDSTLSHLASFYLYRMWDDNRVNGGLDQGYLMIHDLAESAQFPRVITDQRAFFALMSVSAHMLRQLLSNPTQLVELAAIWGNTLRTLPGGRKDSILQGVLSRVIEGLTVIGFQLVSTLALLPGIIFADKQKMNAFFEDPSNALVLTEAFSTVVEYPTLVGHEAQILEIMSRPHPIIPWIYAGVLIYHLLQTPMDNLPLIVYLFGRGNFPVRFWATYALIAFCIIRLSRREVVPASVLAYVYDFGLNQWADRHNPDINFIATGTRTDNCQAILLIEAMQSSYTGTRSPSRFLRTVLSDTDDPINRDDIERILGYLEFVGFQGYPDYMMRLLFSEFQPYWEAHTQSYVTEIITTVRSLYREEVDMFLMSEPRLQSYWDKVRKLNAIPDINEVWYANGQIWVLGMFGNNMTLKIAYLIIECMARGRSTSDFLRRAVQLMMNIIRKPTYLDELFVQARLQRNKSWEMYARWDVPASVYNRLLSETKM